MRHVAGKFDVTISDPHPCWVTLSYDGKEVARFHHNEIMDIAFVIERARRTAIQKLPDNYKHEV